MSNIIQGIVRLIASTLNFYEQGVFFITERAAGLMNPISALFSIVLQAHFPTWEHFGIVISVDKVYILAHMFAHIIFSYWLIV